MYGLIKIYVIKKQGAIKHLCRRLKVSNEILVTTVVLFPMDSLFSYNEKIRCMNSLILNSHNKDCKTSKHTSSENDLCEKKCCFEF